MPSQKRPTPWAARGRLMVLISPIVIFLSQLKISRNILPNITVLHPKVANASSDGVADVSRRRGLDSRLAGDLEAVSGELGENRAGKAARAEVTSRGVPSTSADMSSTYKVGVVVGRSVEPYFSGSNPPAGGDAAGSGHCVRHGLPGTDNLA